MTTYRNAALTGVLFLAVACGGGGTTAPATSATASPAPTDAGRFAYVRTLTCENGLLNGQASNAACFIPVGVYNAATPGPYLASEPIVMADGTSPSFNAPVTQLEAGKRYTFVLSGQVHPRRPVGGAVDPVFGTLHWSVFAEAPFATAAGRAAVSFHNASPYLASKVASAPFGFFDPASLATTPVADLGLGARSPIVAVPDALLSPGAVGFFAVASDATGFQSFPSTFDPVDAGNRMPFNNDRNLTLYALDGRGASADATPPPVGTPPPPVIWVGSYDNDG